jgi:hypothetical protein
VPILVSILPGAESESMVSCETCAAAGPKLASKDANAMAVSSGMHVPNWGLVIRSFLPLDFVLFAQAGAHFIDRKREDLRSQIL